jgi:hypothetical protein
MPQENGTLVAFLGSDLGLRIDPKTSDAFERLGGHEVGGVRLFQTRDDCRQAIEPWMPIFFLPAGQATFTVGIHLRPSDVAKNRLAFMTADDEGEMIEVASSLQSLVYRGLAESEGYTNETGKVPDWVKSSIAEANRVFGADFYQFGRHGKFKSPQTDRMLVDVLGGAAYGFWDLATSLDDPKKQLDVYERGIAVEPGCLALYAGAVEALVALGDRRRAAEQFARSLACYHHTAYTTNLADYFELGRSLSKEFPDLFDDDARWVLSEQDPRNWARRAGELFKAGAVERADKVLNDMCYGIRDYDGAVGAFRKHYERLGWKWALALCDLRA